MVRDAPLFALLLLALSALSASLVDAREYGQLTLVLPLLDSLEQVLRFFSENTASINVDGMSGLRVMQGQLVDIRNDTRVWNSLSSETQDKITAMIEIPDTIYAETRAQMAQFDPAYFTLFVPALTRPVRVDWRRRSLNLPTWDIVREAADYVMTQQEQTVHNYTESDICYSNILSNSKCEISKVCVNMLMRPNKKQYASTHQLIYAQAVEAQGCSEELERSLQKWYAKSVDDVKEDLCRNIYKDASIVYARTNSASTLSDIFLEQNAVCLSAGFIEFLRFDWLSAVVSWQRMNGCFGLEVDDANPVTGRRLLMERSMGGGCGSHISGLAAAYLSSFLKNLLFLL